MRQLFTLLLLNFTMMGPDSSAQHQTVIPIETADNVLVLAATDDGQLRTAYFGLKMKTYSDYQSVPLPAGNLDNDLGISNNVYTASGSTNLFEPALAIVHADGNTSTVLNYVSHQSKPIDSNITETSILLADPVYKTEVTLFFKVFRAENVIEQWSVISNKEKGAIMMNKYASANLHFVADDYYLGQYHGTWAKEMNLEESKLTSGIKSIDTKLGARANLFTPPTFYLAFDHPSQENSGRVLLGQLAWSGNFNIDFEVDPNHGLRVLPGINPHASAYRLEAGQSFTTPSFISVYSEKGKGEASRNLHRWARKYRIMDGNGERLTLLNNWESTYFDFDQEKIVPLFNDVKKLGVDLFLLDDGWFANKYPRNGDTAGLGDWQENRKKLPDGIGYLVREATKAGIKFGIWIEPEMVNPKSELYEKHPEWVIRQPGRKEHYYRNQLVLDLSNPEVQDFVYGVIDNLLSKHPEIAYIKWDCNAVIFNAHSDYLARKGKPQTHLYVDYVKGLYRVMERMRKKFPKTPMMLCSGGGGRVDYGALQYFTEYWPSDNTDPLERVFIQWENALFFPVIAQCNHVTNWSNASIKFKTDVAMMGKMGFDIPVAELNEKDLKAAQTAVVSYEKNKDVIWHGDLYRLADPYSHPYASLMYVDQDKVKAIVFNYLTTNRSDGSYVKNPIKLQGLDPDRKYLIKELNLPEGARTDFDGRASYTGDFLMKAGLLPKLSQHARSVVLEIRALP